ncbi:MAG: hypothetical protein AB9866_30895 [Syntrophobacteraceae bacterium]
MILKEGDLEFDFQDAISGLVFDQMDQNQPNCHGISSMCRVDFVVELNEHILFVEVKDPSVPNPKNIDGFLRKLENGKLEKSMVDKYHGTFIYRWAEKQINKPVHYISLITLDTPMLENLTDKIKKLLPPLGIPVVRWKRPYITTCQILNLETWNDIFPKWPVRRISKAT